MDLSGFLTPKRSREKINDSCVGRRSESFPEPFFLHLEILQTCTFKKKNTHKDTMHSSPVLLAYLSQW